MNHRGANISEGLRDTGNLTVQYCMPSEQSAFAPPDREAGRWHEAIKSLTAIWADQ
jgi:hypothetical protein